jgi:AAHS family 4-hydroxybenzoate transporter-like MFS transporter
MIQGRPSASAAAAQRSDAINVTDLIDRAPVSRYQVFVITLCGLVAILDGFDTQALAFVAPVIAAGWNVPISSFTAVFAAGLLGLTTGSLILGPVADRIGRRTVILIAMAVFGVFSILSGMADSMTTLAICRFLTGAGLGGAMPNLIALTAEYSPARNRAILVTAMFCGIPGGAILGGLVSATWLIPQFGWPSVFYTGGILPLLMLPLVAALRIINRMRHDNLHAAGVRFELREEKLSGIPVRHLFTDGRSPITIPMWVMFFMSLLVMHFLLTWLPSLLRQAGFPVERAIIASVVLNIGGITGGLIFGRLIDKLGPFKVLASAYIAGAVMVAALGLVSGSVSLLMASVFVTGFCLIGAQLGANAFAAAFYPTSVRSTGVGWALGMGRIGSIVGPVLAGIMLSHQLGTREIFLMSGIPPLIAAVAVVFIAYSSRVAGWHHPGRSVTEH